MERASRIMMFSSRKKPPYAANFHSEGSRCCSVSSGKSERLSLRASDTSSSPELEPPKAASGAIERSARDLASMGLELLRSRVCSETRPTSEANSRHPSRTAKAKRFSDAHVQMRTSSYRSLQLLRRRQRILPQSSLFQTHRPSLS